MKWCRSAQDLDLKEALFLCHSVSAFSIPGHTLVVLENLYSLPPVASATSQPGALHRSRNDIMDVALWRQRVSQCPSTLLSHQRDLGTRPTWPSASVFWVQMWPSHRPGKAELPRPGGGFRSCLVLCPLPALASPCWEGKLLLLEPFPEAPIHSTCGSSQNTPLQPGDSLSCLLPHRDCLGVCGMLESRAVLLMIVGHFPCFFLCLPLLLCQPLLRLKLRASIFLSLSWLLAFPHWCLDNTVQWTLVYFLSASVVTMNQMWLPVGFKYG